MLIAHNIISLLQIIAQDCVYYLDYFRVESNKSKKKNVVRIK